MIIIYMIIIIKLLKLCSFVLVDHRIFFWFPLISCRNPN